jgi:hypothetical protein
MLLDSVQFEKLSKALERSMIATLETHRGDCIAVDDETGKEWSHQWRDGKTVVCIEDDESSIEYVFVARLEPVTYNEVK